MKIKKFDQLLTEELYEQKIFDGQKADVLDKLDEFMSEYDEFIRKVSPKHWRSTGTHFTQLRQMKEGIESFTELTEKEKEIDWVKDELNRVESNKPIKKAQ
jgi:hypothetical protein